MLLIETLIEEIKPISVQKNEVGNREGFFAALLYQESEEGTTSNVFLMNRLPQVRSSFLNL